MILGKRFLKKVKETVNDPNFQKPLSELNKDYSDPNTVLTLITRI